MVGVVVGVEVVVLCFGFFLAEVKGLGQFYRPPGLMFLMKQVKPALFALLLLGLGSLVSFAAELEEIKLFFC